MDYYSFDHSGQYGDNRQIVYTVNFIVIKTL